MRIAITGGIGSGKSYVCQRLKERGIGVYDCDAGAKKLMASSEEIRSALVKLIGEDAYNGWTLNKAVVAKFLLESESNKLAINAIVHPAVIRDISKERAKQWIDAQIPQAEVAKRADAVIVNDGVEDIEAQIDKVLTLFGIEY